MVNSRHIYLIKHSRNVCDSWFSTSKQHPSAFCCIWVKDNVRTHPEVELRTYWKFKNPAYSSFSNPKSVGINSKSYLTFCFPGFDSYERTRYKKKALNKLVDVRGLFFLNICIQHYIDILNNYTSVVMLFRKVSSIIIEYSAIKWVISELQSSISINVSS